MARQFGSTWWGKAWVSALETSIMADDGRLSRGRTYARQGRVSLPEILPGSVRAEVTGKEEYVADLSIRVLSDEDWDRLAVLIAGKSAYAAALLSGELPVDLLEDAEDEGIRLLPGAGQIVPDCSCPDWGDPCKHAAAIAYLLADAIDADPFVLLLLRGRGRSELLEEVRKRRHASVSSTSAGSAESSRGGGGVDVSDSVVEGELALRAYARHRAALPVPLQPPIFASRSIAFGTPPPIDSGLRLGELEGLVTDAAFRAGQVLDQVDTSGLELDRDADLARRAAMALDHPEYLLALAESTGLEFGELMAQAIAWNQGGEDGLWISSQSWSPPVEKLEEARMQVGPRSRVVDNCVSGNGMQLRLDQNGLWWRFRPDDEFGWVLASQGFTDPAELV